MHAFGVRQTVQRKVLRRGQRTVTARLGLGASEAVLGVPALAMAGRAVALEDLWGQAATERLCARLAEARDTAHAAAVLVSALAERLATSHGRKPHAELALAAAGKLGSATVSAVAADLGVSERQLRRVFDETVGLSPKTFAKLARFRRALDAAGAAPNASWASIAAAAGYYDQSHLIGEFRAIAGVTPRVLQSELRLAPSLG